VKFTTNSGCCQCNYFSSNFSIFQKQNTLRTRYGIRARNKHRSRNQKNYHHFQTNISATLIVYQKWPTHYTV